MWRNLYLQFEGGSELVQYTKRKVLNQWPKCNDLKDLHQHLDDWEAALGKYGKDLLQNPAELYHRVLEIIPQSLEDEIVLKNDEITTYQDVIAFCKKRTFRLRHIAQSKAATKTGSSRKVAAVLRTPAPTTEGRVDDGNFTKQLNDMIVAAVKSQAGAKPSHTGARTPPRGRSESPRPPPPPPFKYPDNECMECGATTHRRADCPVFKKVLAANDGKWPKGHKGKFEKARDAHQKKHGRGASRGRLHSRERALKKTTHVKQLDAADENSSGPDLTDSSDSDGDNPTLAASVVSQRTQ